MELQYGILRFDEPKPDISRKIIHVDMDAFYASVELRDNPSLQGKPIVIAKHPNLTGGRGIVSTCNYVAREYGIHSAMSASEAYRLCPHAVFIPPNHSHYREVSQEIHEIFRRFTDMIEPVSLDEAYLDITSNKVNINSATIIAKQIQRLVYEEIKLTCSIGASYNKYIAKIASDYRKPAGLTVIEPHEAIDFLKSLDIKQFPGVGSKTLTQFRDEDINTGADLYKKSLDYLITNFGKLGYSLYFRVRGISNAPVRSNRDRKSLGKERTFRHFIDNEADALAQINRIIDLINTSHPIEELKAHTLTLKIRYDDFETITRQQQRVDPIASVEESLEIAYNLWEENAVLDKSIRLLGVTFSNFDHPLIENITLF